MGVFVLVFIVGGVAVAISSLSRIKKRNKLDSIGALLGGGSDQWGYAWGDALGAMAHLSFVTRGSGSNSESWTEIDVDLPAKYPLEMMIRPHGLFDRGKIERGTMIDVEVGDVAFDNEFLVEAAPADVVRKLLDAQVRARLFRLPRFQLSKLSYAPTLRLELRGWVEPEVVRTAVAIMAAIANSLRTAYSQVEAETPPVITGSPFRQEIDDGPARLAAAGRAAEVENVKRLRIERQRQSKMVGAIIVTVVTVGFLILMLR